MATLRLKWLIDRGALVEKRGDEYLLKWGKIDCYFTLPPFSHFSIDTITQYTSWLQSFGSQKPIQEACIQLGCKLEELPVKFLTSFLEQYLAIELEGINQCDGCLAGYRVERGIHYTPYPSGPMGCQAYKYLFKLGEIKWLV